MRCNAPFTLIRVVLPTDEVVYYIGSDVEHSLLEIRGFWGHLTAIERNGRYVQGLANDPSLRRSIEIVDKFDSTLQTINEHISFEVITTWEYWHKELIIRFLWDSEWAGTITCHYSNNSYEFQVATTNAYINTFFHHNLIECAKIAYNIVEVNPYYVLQRPF